MNRYKAEEARKRREARAGLTEFEVQQLDQEEAIEADVMELARKIHFDRFPEEWDFILDDNVDYTNRRNGMNPMSDEYIQNTNKKRTEVGLTPLSDAGTPIDDFSWEIAHKDAEAVVRGRR